MHGSLPGLAAGRFGVIMLIFTTCPIYRSKTSSPVSRTIRPLPFRNNRRSVIWAHARCQEASLAANKRGGRSEQAQQGSQRHSDLNVHLAINRERLSERLSCQRSSPL